MNGPRREFARYVSLNVLGMIGLSCYILADTFFVSQRLGADGLAALNLAIPVYSFLHGSGLMIGMGGATRYAIRSGRGDRRAAAEVFPHAVYLAAAFAALFTLPGLTASGKLAALLGAQGGVHAMTEIYLKTILLFSPAFLMNNVLLCFVRNDGAPHRSMAAMIGGSLSNVLLDWVFLFPCGMGMFGAAFATGLAPVISMLILSPHFLRRRCGFSFRLCRPRGRLLLRILSGGVPSLVTEVSSGVVMIAFNAILLGLSGNTGVAAYGVIANLSLVALAVCTGIAQGVQPLLSRACGRGDAPALSRTLRDALAVMAAFSLLLYAAVFFGAGEIARLFNSGGSARLQQIAVDGLRIYFTACPFAGFNIILSIYFTSTDRPLPAHAVSLLRGFVVILPAAFLLAALFGLAGVWCAFPVSELLVAAAGLVLWRRARLPAPAADAPGQKPR